MAKNLEELKNRYNSKLSGKEFLEYEITHGLGFEPIPHYEDSQEGLIRHLAHMDKNINDSQDYLARITIWSYILVQDKWRNLATDAVESYEQTNTEIGNALGVTREQMKNRKMSQLSKK